MSESIRDKSLGPESLTMMLISEIAEQEGINPGTLTPPISTIIDVDALEAIFSGGNDGPVKVEFTYSGHEITIEGEEEIQLEVE